MSGKRKEIELQFYERWAPHVLLFCQLYSDTDKINEVAAKWRSEHMKIAKGNGDHWIIVTKSPDRDRAQTLPRQPAQIAN